MPFFDFLGCCGGKSPTNKARKAAVNCLAPERLSGYAVNVQRAMTVEHPHPRRSVSMPVHSQISDPAYGNSIHESCHPLSHVQSAPSHYAASIGPSASCAGSQVSSRRSSACDLGSHVSGSSRGSRSDYSSRSGSSRTYSRAHSRCSNSTVVSSNLSSVAEDDDNMTSVSGQGRRRQERRAARKQRHFDTPIEKQASAPHITALLPVAAAICAMVCMSWASTSLLLALYALVVAAETYLISQRPTQKSNGGMLVYGTLGAGFVLSVVVVSNASAGMAPILLGLVEVAIFLSCAGAAHSVDRSFSSLVAVAK